MPSLSRACKPRNDRRAPTEFDLCCLHSPSEFADMIVSHFYIGFKNNSTHFTRNSEKKGNKNEGKEIKTFKDRQNNKFKK